jgi:Nuclease-related domain
MSCLDCSPHTSPLPQPSVDAGIAGHSARMEHQRRVAMREAKLKAQWGDRVGGWVTKLTDEPSSTQAWATGAVGEERLGRILDGLEDVAVLHDRRIPGRRSNIDHIVFAPPGIFVVDTKHYAGQIQVRRRGSFFRPEDRLHVGRWDRTDDVSGVKAQVAIVESVLLSSDVEPKPPVTPVLCFTRAEWPLFGSAKSFAGVYLESDRSLKKLLTASADFSTEELARARRAIALGLPTR